MQVNGTSNTELNFASARQREAEPVEKVEAPEKAGAGQFFVTPFLKFDSEAATVLFQVRDSDTGDVKKQFPPESVVDTYRSEREERLAELAEDLGLGPAIEPTGEDDAEQQVAPQPQRNSEGETPDNRVSEESAVSSSGGQSLGGGAEASIDNTDAFSSVA